VWWTRVRVKITAAVFIHTAAPLEDTHVKKRQMCFQCHKLDTLSHIINLSRDFSDAHIELSRMFLRDTVGNAKAHSLKLITLFLGVLEGRIDISVRAGEFWKRGEHEVGQLSFGRPRKRVLWRRVKVTAGMFIYTASEPPDTKFNVYIWAFRVASSALSTAWKVSDAVFFDATHVLAVWATT